MRQRDQFTRTARLGLLLGWLWAGAAAAGPAPGWFADHLAELTADGGVWIADNAAYRSEQEKAEAYGLQWRYGVGKRSAVGRLYAIIGGQDTGTIWEFRMYWHPGQDQALLLQFGAGGAVLNGPLTVQEDGSDRLQQTFYRPDGSQVEIGHLTRHPAPGVHEGGSYDIDAEGNWQARRSYTWHRQPAAG